MQTGGDERKYLSKKILSKIMWPTLAATIAVQKTLN